MAQQPHFSAAADRNKEIILEQLRLHLPKRARVLEVASGTAQHALHFAAALPDMTWQTSDRDLAQYGLEQAVEEAGLANLPAPLQLDVTAWPENAGGFDAVYSANCIHVMPHENLAPYVKGAASALKPNGKMMLYGPFKYGGEFTTPSNEEFNHFLGERYSGAGIRDFEEVDALAQAQGLVLVHDAPMPSNNQFIVWRKWAGGA
ncbi:MAG: DUF938 domain-containing protein [Pseudomonadota bacterium]